MKVLDCRVAAAQILLAVQSQGQSLERQLARFQPSVRERDHALLRELCYGSLRWYPQLDALLTKLLQKPLKERDYDIHALLVIGAYQILFTRIPAHAALSTVVEACRSLQKSWATGLVNAVLRTLQREHTQLLEQLPASARAAHPQWLWQTFKEAWPAQLESILAANNAHPPMCLRVNRRRQSRADYLAALEKAGLAATACANVDSGLRLQQPCDVDALPDFAAGAVSVQDESAQLAATLLSLAPGLRVLDACCAPGGKTGHLLEQPEILKVVWALDSSALRLQRVAANLARLTLDATLICGDASQPAQWWDGVPFERILLDAPCSGTGVIRRHPDIKLLRRSSDIEKLAAFQLQLLQALWPLLAPGGLLVYATCSILPAENTETIATFLAQTTDAQELPIDAQWGVAQVFGRQILPTLEGGDGFFYARLQKKLFHTSLTLLGSNNRPLPRRAN